jgi:AcrR family transcriptional regulator
VIDARIARKERRREQVREEVLEAAGRVLVRRGLAGFTLAAVARELQLTKPALYHYFDSKEALVFELIHGSISTHADYVGRAIDEAGSGADAIEALIRASAEYYREHPDELRLTFFVPQVGAAGTSPFGPAQREQLRPYNDRVYGTCAAKIRADQDAGDAPADLDARRYAFLAHLSVIGVLTIEGLIESADDAPLMHRSDAMIDDLVRVHRLGLAMPQPAASESKRESAASQDRQISS